MKILSPNSDFKPAKSDKDLLPKRSLLGKIFFHYKIIQDTDGKVVKIARFNLFERLFAFFKKAYYTRKITKKCPGYSPIPKDFFTSKVSEKSPRTGLEKKQAEFRKKALNRFREKTNYTFPHSIDKVASDPDILKKVKERLDDQSGDTQFEEGGNNKAIFIEECPDFVFKVRIKPKRRDKARALKIEQMTDEARKICEEKNLYLLYPPKAKAVHLGDGVYCVVQEKMEIPHSWKEQKSAYRYIQTDKELRAYATELFKQLAEFCIAFDLYDVKLDNIPLTKQGFVSLHDLDQTGKKGEGLYSSLLKGTRKGGVFKPLILKESKTVEDFARKILKKKVTDLSKFKEKVEEHRRQRAHRTEKTKGYRKYAKRLGIEGFETRVVIDKDKLEKLFGKSSQEYDLAVNFLKGFNETLKSSEEKELLDLRAGRKKAYWTDSIAIQGEKLEPFLQKLKGEDLIYDFSIKKDPKGREYINLYF